MPPQSPIIASSAVHSLLTRLHAESTKQEQTWSHYLFNLRRQFFGATLESVDAFLGDKFVALEPEKCHFVYLLARSMGARNIIEAGTSFGVSTIYLSLAVGQNGGGRVIATEKEGKKAEKAREYWKEAGEEVEKHIELREGDILETLKEGVGEVDMLLLDIWTPLALPVLKLVKPRLKKGAVVIADNTTQFKMPYREFLEYLDQPENGLKHMTAPFSNGLEVAVYLPEE